VIEELISDNLVDHDEMAKQFPPGKEGARRIFQAMKAGFPDLRMDIDSMIAEGDRVVVFSTMKGTHQGEFMGIPATGKSVAVPVADMVRFQDGKAAEHWGVTDGGMMMQQLGLVEAP
jgi:steroid delta-isomerase-like uncharacterized protein